MTENLLCCRSRITTEDISPCKLSSKTRESSNVKNLLPPLQHVPNIKDSKSTACWWSKCLTLTGELRPCVVARLVFHSFDVRANRNCSRAPNGWHVTPTLALCLVNLISVMRKTKCFRRRLMKIIDNTEERTETIRPPMCFKRNNGGPSGDVFVSKIISLPCERAQDVSC
jgi:hypothetical protein